MNASILAELAKAEIREHRQVPADSKFTATYSYLGGAAIGHGATEDEAIDRLGEILAFNLEHNGCLI